MEHVVHFFTSTAGLITAAGVIFAAIAATFRVVWRNYKLISTIMEELTPNHGKSMRDSINRIEAMQLAAMQLTGRAFWISNAEGYCTFASVALAKIMGVSQTQILGWGWVSSVALEDRERCRDEWDAAVKDHREFHLRYSYTLPSGDKVLVVGHAIPVLNGDRMMGMVGWAEVV